ncbi:MAG: hypothetical protein MJ112_03380 [Lachnospiraceae bacterium]|nr:hypothetical protein [Lachnospiraceae bacterium]
MDEQTKRVIETMSLCGCDVDALCSMFPGVTREEIETVYKKVREEQESQADADDEITISCNCS